MILILFILILILLTFSYKEKFGMFNGVKALADKFSGKNKKEQTQDNTSVSTSVIANVSTSAYVGEITSSIAFEEEQTEEQECNFIPWGKNELECIENCKSYKNILNNNDINFNNCDELNCIKKCKNCENLDLCKWNNTKIENTIFGSKINLSGMFNKLEKKIKLSWNKESILSDIFKEIQYDDIDTKIKKMLKVRNYIENTNCDTNLTDTKCDELNKDLDETQFTFKDGKCINKLNKTICEKEKHKNNFYIHYSTNKDVINSENIIRINFDNKGPNINTFTYDFCVNDDVKSSCEHDNTLNNNIQYIFYISRVDDNLPSNIITIQT